MLPYYENIIERQWEGRQGLVGGNRSLGECSGRVCLVYKPSLSLSALPSGSREVSNLAQPHGHATMMPTAKVQFSHSGVGRGWGCSEAMSPIIPASDCFPSAFCDCDRKSN